VPEPKLGENSVPLIKRLKVQYPDRPHNAEAIAVTPFGDILIATKEEGKEKTVAQPSELFLLPFSKWSAAKETEKLTLNPIGKIDFPKLLKDQEFWGKIVTSMDISADGKRLLFLTYRVALEAAIDFSQIEPPVFSSDLSNVNYRIISSHALPQQEAVAYLKAESSFLYSTEKRKPKDKALLYSHRCLN
jgi:hypothetical protein